MATKKKDAQDGGVKKKKRTSAGLKKGDTKKKKEKSSQPAPGITTKLTHSAKAVRADTTDSKKKKEVKVKSYDPSNELPVGYAKREFLKINAPGELMVRVKNSLGAPVTKLYRRGLLIAKDTAPPELEVVADNPACFFTSQKDGQAYFKVETVVRVVRVEGDALVGGKRHETIMNEAGVQTPTVNRMGDVDPAAGQHILMDIIKKESGIKEFDEKLLH